MSGSMPSTGNTVLSRRPVLRTMRDLCAGLALFVVFTVALSADSPAALFDANVILALAAPSAERAVALICVAVAFSAFFAFNVGLWRHLRQASAVSRSDRRSPARRQGTEAKSGL